MPRMLTKLTAIAQHPNGFAIGLMLGFLVISLGGLIHHELWRDEFQGWLIATNSHSIAELLQNQRYESGRSIFSFLGFWGISRFSRSPIAMQLFHLAISTATIFLIARFSPFTHLQKVALTFSYFLFFEYSIICRDYAPGVLSIIIFCCLFPRRDLTYLPLAFCLFVAANTHFYALLVSFALGLMLFLEKGVLELKRLFKCLLTFNVSLFSSRRSWDFTVSGLIWLAGIAIAISFMQPPPDGTISAQLEKPFSIKHVISSLAIIWKSYAPMPGLTYHFWNTNLLDDGIAAVLSLGLLGVAIVRFKQQPIVLLAYLLGTLSILYMTYAKFPGTMRHWGYLFILFIACWWIETVIQAEQSSPSKFGSTKNLNQIKPYSLIVLNGLLIIQCAAGLFAFCSDGLHPFSEAKAMAQFIQTHTSGDELIVGDPDWAALPVGGYLERPLYYPTIANFGTFIRFNNQRFDQTSNQVIHQVNQLADTHKQSILLVLNYPLEEQLKTGLNRSAVELARFTQAIVLDENYYLYQLLP